MSKKRFRPRSHGGRTGGGGGYGGGGYYQGSNGQGGGGGRSRRRRYYQDRERPPFGGEAAPHPQPLGEDGNPLPEGAVGEGTEFQNPPVTPEQVLEPGYGLLEMHPNGYGFLRSPETTYTRERSDPFVPGTMIEKYRLRQGVMIKGTVQPARRQQGPRLRDITDVDGLPPDEYPTIVELADELSTDDSDGLFQFGLDIWLRAIEAMAGRRRRVKP